MAVEIDIIYEGDLICRATHGPSGDTLRTDAPVDNGGKGSAFSPTDLCAAALGTCLVTIMGLVAKQHNWDLSGTRVQVTKDMASTPVRRIGALTATITLPPGSSFAESERAMLQRAAETCPVAQSLHPDVNVLTKFVYPS